MYIPNDTVLKKYADVLIKYALWSGHGAKKDDVIFLSIAESARTFLPHLQRSILEAGAHMILQYVPDGIARDYYLLANDSQIEYVPRQYLLERVNASTHFVHIISESDKHELEGIDGKKIMRRGEVSKFYMDARRQKEDEGRLTWTLGLYATEAMAKEVGMSLRGYWKEIIHACYLDYDDPIAKWRETTAHIEHIKSWLNSLKIMDVHVKGKDADLYIKIGPDRQWLGGSGRNIPSFELYISPDWRGTKGWIRFNKPLYRYGNLIKDVELKFDAGIVVNAKASQNEQILKDMIAVQNADKVGEFSLTDHRFSRITKFMGETLFDENVGGTYGNTHIALGAAYRDSYPKNSQELTDDDWATMGYNDSSVHTDVVSTTDRTVTATLADGRKKVIYKKGRFCVDES